MKSGGCWKWGACGCAAALAITIVGIAAIVAIVFGLIKSTDAYRGALASARKDPRVIEAFGAPVHAGFWALGTVHVDNGEGEADIHFPLIGSKDRGIVHAVATKRGGEWHYSELTASPRNGNTIDLLNP